MPVLPIIDLLILLGWTTLAAGGVLKAIYIATSYRPTLFSLTPVDLLLVALAFLGLALTLAARTWVRINEPELMARRRASTSRQARARAQAQTDAHSDARPEESERPRLEPDRTPAAAGAAGESGRWQRVR